MYCTNCGAQVNPEDRFCIKCGFPVDPDAVNVSVTEEALKESAPPKIQVPAPKKKRVWPVVAGIVAALVVVSVGTGLLIKKIIDTVTVKTSGSIDYSIGPFEGEFGDADEPDFGDFDEYTEIDPDDYGFGAFDPDDYGFGAFGPDDYGFGNFGPYGFDFDEFFEEFGNTDPFYDYSGSRNEYTEYEYRYAYAYYYDDCVSLEGRDVLKDSTVIFGGRTLGDFCDYIDNNVLEKGRTIDRELLYDLLEVHMVDPDLISDNEEYFEQSMMYCLTFANEFANLDMEVESCTYYLDEPSVYYYEVEAQDKEDTWIVDYSEKTVYMGGGDREYKSVGDYSMFSDNTLSIYLTAIDEFFGIE